MCSRLQIAAVLCLGLVLGLASPAGATFAGRNGAILFSVYPSKATRGRGGVWSINPTTRRLKFILDDSSCPPTSGMRYSPDGRRIAYYGFCQVPPHGFVVPEIFTMTSTGAHRRLLVKPDGQEDLMWSPDGRKIAYTTGNVLTIVDSTSGRELRRYPWHGPSRGATGPMSWGKDNRIHSGLYSVRVDGTHPQTLKVAIRRPPNHAASITRVAWSPSGRKIAVVDEWPTFSCLAADTGGAIRFDPVCSEEDHDDIYVMSVSGRSQHRLTADGASATPIWSPDGQDIAFYDADNPGISIVPASGGQTRQIGTSLRLQELADWQAL
jgi:Tol biopolymer transport system component